MKSCKLAAVFLFISFGAVRCLFAQELVNLGDLGGGYSVANGINDFGQAVGWSNTSSGYQDAFLYSGGTMTDLGTLGGYYSTAAGINNAGQVVGYSDTSNYYDHAFLYSGGTMNDLGTLLGYGYSSAAAINNAGQVVGTSNGQAFLYSNGSMSGLGTLQGTGNTIHSQVIHPLMAAPTSIATGINDSGQVVGQAITSAYNYHAFLYSGVTMTDLGTLPGGDYSQAAGINNAGQVVGYSYTSSGSEDAFLYSGGTMADLGTLGGGYSQATGINDSGQVVGYSDGDAFIYSAGTGMTDLNSLYSSQLVSGIGAQAGFTSLNQANAINAAGDIVGTGVYWNGTSLTTQAAFLLEPAPPPPPPPVIPTSTQSTVPANTAYNTTTVAPVTSNGGLGTTVSLVGGTAGSATTVTLASTNLGANFKSLASDVVSVTGNAGDIFAIQLTFNLAAANALPGGANAMTLLWLDPDGDWENAVLGNTGANTTNPLYLDYSGSFASFEAAEGANDANLSSYLGAYGVDTTSDTVWAVIDHNSPFGVGSEFLLPQEVPEPSTWAMLLGGLGLLAFWRLRTRCALV